MALAEHFPGPISVSLMECAKLTDAAVMGLAEHCPGLTSVNLGCCRKPTDAAVVALAEHCPGLTWMDLGCCGELTDAAVVALAGALPGPHLGGPDVQLLKQRHVPQFCGALFGSKRQAKPPRGFPGAVRPGFVLTARAVFCAKATRGPRFHFERQSHMDIPTRSKAFGARKKLA